MDLKYHVYIMHLYGPTPYIDKMELVDSLTLFQWPCLSCAIIICICAAACAW